MTPPKERLTRRLEDYLEAVLLLTQQDGVARVRDIAAQTHVNKSTVTAALKHLAQAGLVNHDPYQLVTLTDRGKIVANEIRGRHDALVAFLTRVLDVAEDRANENACRMEHVVDDEVLDRLSLLAEFIRQRPADQGDWLEKFSAFCRRRRSRRGGASARSPVRAASKT